MLHEIYKMLVVSHMFCPLNTSGRHSTWRHARTDCLLYKLVVHTHDQSHILVAFRGCLARTPTRCRYHLAADKAH